MKIEPTYVTFEQAKLLFEKGFPGATEDDAVYTIHDKTRVYPLKYIKEGLFYHAPEQHIVVEWLRVNQGIWISVHLELCRGYEGYDFNFEYINDKEKTIIEQEKQYKELGETVFNSPQEAYSAAFDYILKELI